MDTRGKLRNEGGQAILEYILLLTIVLGALGYFIREMSGKFDEYTALSGGKLERQLRTGSAPAGLWKK